MRLPNQVRFRFSVRVVVMIMVTVRSVVSPFMALARTSGSWSWISRRAAGKISVATSSGVKTSA